MARFITQHEEDQAQLQKDAKEHFRLRIIVTNYRGNAQQVLSHPKGEASAYAR